MGRNYVSLQSPSLIGILLFFLAIEKIDHHRYSRLIIHQRSFILFDLDQVRGLLLLSDRKKSSA